MKFKERAKSQFDGPKKFITLKDGESVNGVLRGELYEYGVKWVNGKAVEVDSNDPEGSTKWKVNFIVFEEGKFVAKVLNIGVLLYDQLFEFSREMELEKTKLKITRKGSGTDTTYIAIPTGQLDLNVQAQLSKIELNILNSQPKKQETHDFGSPPKFEDPPDELPF